MKKYIFHITFHYDPEQLIKLHIELNYYIIFNLYLKIQLCVEGIYSAQK